MFWSKKKDDNLKDLEKEIENLEEQEQQQEQQEEQQKEDSCEQKFEALNDKYLRQVAEFENFKRRSNEEKLQNFNLWWKEVLKAVLPFLDNFKRAMDACDDELKENEWVKWIVVVEENLVKDLEKIWFQKIDAKWKKMDFRKHEALMQDANMEKDVVSQVLEEWYEYNWEVVRVAKVSVWSK